MSELDQLKLKYEQLAFRVSQLENQYSKPHKREEITEEEITEEEYQEQYQKYVERKRINKYHADKPDKIKTYEEFKSYYFLLGTETHPVEAGKLRKGDYLLIDGRPCKIIETHKCC